MPQIIGDVESLWIDLSWADVDSAGDRRASRAVAGRDELLTWYFTAVDRPQANDRLHVLPAAFHFQELLVAQRDVLGAELRVRGAQQILAVEVGLGSDLHVHAQQPPRVMRRNRLRPGLVEMTPSSRARSVLLNLSTWPPGCRPPTARPCPASTPG